MRAWWLGALGAVSVAASCGGVSTRRSGDDGSGGSTGGEGAASPERGGVAGSAGRGSGGGPGAGGVSIGTGGRGGGGTTAGGGKGGTDDGEPGGIGGIGGGCSDEADDTAFPCRLSGYDTSCTISEACTTLECGRPWSPFDAKSCLRDRCMNSSQCSAGQRCLAEPVAGRFAPPHYDFAECFRSARDCSCGCDFYDDGVLVSGVCLTPAEVPAIECPIENFDCDALIDAYYATRAHIRLFTDAEGEGSDATGAGGAAQSDTLEDLEACLAKITMRTQTCPF